jgi:S-DNA-T family DNA segregation ATPase FtsK/SpoIIIE
MLYMPGAGRVQRVHGPFVSDEEVEQVVSFLKTQGEPDYKEEVTEEDQGEFDGMSGGPGGSSGDELYDRAVELVCRERKASTSFVQRHLQIGYNRAARIIDQMEKEGVIGPPITWVNAKCWPGTSMTVNDKGSGFFLAFYRSIPLSEE